MNAGLARPVFCLVTDRRRFQAGPAELVRLVRLAAEAGVGLVHVRERDLDDRSLLSLTREILEAVERTPAMVVVNDRTDIALAAGAHGVHLRADSPPAGQVRAMVPDGFLIGRSVHDEREAIRAAASGVDYLVLGTIYATPSKPSGTPCLGPDALSRVTRAVPVPVLAIGGVSADNVSQVAAAGAAGLAAIGLFAGVSSELTDGSLAAGLRTLMTDLQAAFRSPS